MTKLWDLLKTEEEKDYLRSFMPPGWHPHLTLLHIESVEEIQRLMQQKPQARLAGILAGATMK